jgi:uncharacterized Tic20 family protein
MDNTTVSATPSRDDCNLAMLAHLLGVITGFVGPLVIWLIKKDSSAFIDQEAKEALNFQITIVIGWVIAAILSMILIGGLLFPVLMVVNLVCCILGAVSASKGMPYRYPFAIRLLK